MFVFFAFFAVAFVFVPDLNAVLGEKVTNAGVLKWLLYPLRKPLSGVKCFGVDFVNFCDFL